MIEPYKQLDRDAQKGAGTTAAARTRIQDEKNNKNTRRV